MIIQDINGKCYIREQGILGAMMLKVDHLYEVSISYNFGQTRAVFSNIDDANKLIESINDFSEEKTKSELDNFKEGVEYSLKLIESKKD